MEIAVLGGGMVGSLIATELSKDYNITVIDNEPRNIEGTESKIMDVNSKESVSYTHLTLPTILLV